MGVRINPCHGCPLREGCEQRTEFRRRVSGLGLRSATFRCGRLDEALRPGRRIMISTPYMEDRSSYWEPDYRVRHKAVPATITGAHDGTFTCTIDPGHVVGKIDCDGAADEESVEKYRFRRRMRAQRIIRFLDEPDQPICRNGRVQRDGKCDSPREERDKLGAQDGGCYCANEVALAAEEGR